METPLLTTKLYIPPARPGLVARPRLIERLRSALSCTLTLISAPAGFGKTTLVSEWIRQNDPSIPTAWLSLDEGDNDPVRFWDYFIAALKTLHPATGERSLALLHSTPPPPIESVLTTLSNDLTATSEDFAFVLDDYHFIKSEAIHTGIAFLLDHLPPRMHLVIATREDPPLPLSHLRGRGSMLEIGADDLRFTPEEAGGLLQQLPGPELSIDDIKALNTRAEGWAVGLKMAGLSLGQRKDVKSFIAAFAGSHRFIMDYLIDEVLKQQSEDIQDFLLQTSVLERLTAPLCDSVTGRSDSQDMLSKLERANLFIVPLDESRHWYRYHHLFAELLRHRLEMVPGTKEVPLLHQRASRWYADNNFPDDAIHHALAARDWERAMRLIYDQSEARFYRVELNTLLRWLQVIPDEVLRTHPRLYSHYCAVLMTLGQTEAAEAALSHLERMAQGDASLQGELAAHQMTLARQRGDVTHTVEFAERALALLPPDAFNLRAGASAVLGQVQLFRARLGEAWSLWTDADEMLRQSGNYFYRATVASGLSHILWLRGRLRQALNMGQQAVELAGPSLAASVPRRMLAAVLYERNDLEGAAFSFRLAVELSELGGYRDVQIPAYFYLAQKRLAQGDVAGANAAMVKADEAARHPAVSSGFRAIHAANRVMVAIQQDDLDAALDWGNRLSEYPDDILGVWLQHVPARLLIARGEKAAAAAQLQGVYERAVQADAQGFAIKIRIYQALAAPTPDEALTFLAEALKMGQPEDFIRTFVDEGKLLAPLLRKALSQGILPEYTRKLLGIIEAEERQRRAVNREATSSVTPSGPLSGRELEILRLVAAGLSNRQISERLIISLGTVKTHVHNIFEKLEAKDRLQAVTRARDLRLI